MNAARSRYASRDALRVANECATLRYSRCRTMMHACFACSRFAGAMKERRGCEERRVTLTKMVTRISVHAAV